MEAHAMRDAATAADRSGDLVTGDGRRPEVAIVGGSPAGALVASVLCQQFGCTTTTMQSGEAVLALLRSDAAVDLVVMDLAVPDMEGMVAVQMIRALGRRNNLPVVALTSEGNSLGGSLAGAAGFAAAILKPYSPRELHAAMAAALRQQAASALVS